MTGLTVQDLLQLQAHDSRNMDGMRRRVVRRVTLDSRRVEQGDVFVALRGMNFDGHDFIDEALERGALFCVVKRPWFARHGRSYMTAPLYITDDCIAALGAFARQYRKLYNIPVVAITGSNGKTTTKEMIAAVLGTRYPVLHTEGNLNNHIGVPMTLFRLMPRHRVAVVEFGTNQPGDIAYLSAIAQQSHALVTNIGHAHVELLGSRRGVAREKCMIFRALPPYGIAFINADEPYLEAAAANMKQKVRYGTTPECDVILQSVEVDARGRPTISLRAPRYTKKEIFCSLRTAGVHTAYNALAAFAVGFVFQCAISKIVRALESYDSYESRLEVIRCGAMVLLNDSYNANPESTVAAIETLMALKSKGDKVIILGDMLELGSYGRVAHERLGRYIRQKRIRALITLGRDTRHTSRVVRGGEIVTRHYGRKSPLLHMLPKLIRRDDTVLVKGSRGMHMEDVVETLRALGSDHKLK